MNDEVFSLAREIVSAAVNELTASYPYFSYAAGAFFPELSQNVDGIATDGEKIFVSPEHALKKAALGESLSGEILHVILHLLLLHPFKKFSSANSSLAADVDTGELLDERLGAFPDRDHKNKTYRKSVYKSIKSDFKAFNGEICEEYAAQLDEEMKARVEKLFKVCDHGLWKNDERTGKSESAAEKRVREIARRVSESSSVPDGVRSRIKVALCEGEYTRLVKKFLTSSETKGVNDEEFDYIYYCLGFERYGNMPLIEDLEYKDDKTLSDVVIAIDVSGSTLGKPVEKFVSETFSLVERENAERRRFRVRIVQCDDRITSDETLLCGEDLARFTENFHISGGGATDFRPVFDLVAESMKAGRRTKCIVYFTDGKGIFPESDVGVKTCFALFGKDADKIKIPPFAYKIILGE